MGHWTQLRPQLGDAVRGECRAREITAEKGEWHNETTMTTRKTIAQAGTRSRFDSVLEASLQTRKLLFSQRLSLTADVNLKFRRIAMGRTVGRNACTNFSARRRQR